MSNNNELRGFKLLKAAKNKANSKPNKANLPGFARKSEALSSKSEVIMQNKPNFGKADEGFYGFFRETAIYDIDLRGKMA